jgi:ferredoxin
MTWRLVVNQTRCDGAGYCAELVPEVITLDDWGYPITGDTPVEGHVLAHAQRAVRLCPRQAIALIRSAGPAQPSPPPVPLPPSP